MHTPIPWSADDSDPRLASAIDECSLWCARFGDMLLEQIELPRRGAILDVDCGTGFPLLELADRCPRECRFIGVDLWHAALRRAVEKRDFCGRPNVLIARADAARLPVPSAAVDLIVMNLGINNYDDPAAVLRECARVAKPSGRLVMTTNARGCYGEFYDLYAALLAERGMTDALDRLRENAEHRGSRESLTAALAAAGLRVEKAVERDLVVRFVDGAAMLRHPLTRLGFLASWQAVAGPDHADAIISELERRMNDSAARRGALHMTVPMLYLSAVRE